MIIRIKFLNKIQHYSKIFSQVSISQPDILLFFCVRQIELHPTFLGSRIDQQKTAPSSGPNKISLSRQDTFPFRCLHHLFSHSGARPDRNVIHLLMRISPRQLVCNFPFRAVHLHTTDPANRFTRAPTSGVRLIAHFNFLWYIYRVCETRSRGSIVAPLKSY